MVEPVIIKSRQAKKHVRFSFMVAGQQGLGKTTLLTTFFEGKINPLQESEEKPHQFHVYAPTDQITVYKLDEDEEGIKLDLEVVDTPGFNDDTSPDMVLSMIMNFIEKTFHELFEEEGRVRRNPKFEEHRVHVVLYLIEPTGLDLKPVDAEFIKRLSERVNVIPLVAKADSLTKDALINFKSQLMQDFHRQNIPIFKFQEFSENGSYELMPLQAGIQPLSVIGSVAPRHGDTRKGRPYPWGTAESENPEHCDFSLLKRALISFYRDELKEITEDILYEKYRTEKLEELNLDKSSPQPKINSDSKVLQA